MSTEAFWYGGAVPGLDEAVLYGDGDPPDIDQQAEVFGRSSDQRRPAQLSTGRRPTQQ